MEELNKNDMIDLGSDPIGEDFDPFDMDEDNDVDDGADNEAATETDQTADTASSQAVAETTADEPKEEASTPTTVTNPATTTKTAEPTESAGKKAETKEADTTAFADKLPVFEYAGATENIDDVSKTFDELRIEKSADFPELEDGKRVSWTVEYGKITKTVADPKGTSIGKMKSDIETSKEFEDSLRKRGADKNPSCKVKPRVTAQSKGNAAPSYRGVFANLEEVEAAGKVISIVPGKDGRVYEIRSTDMGKFITPVIGCDLLSDIRAGFIPALPLIPADLMMQVFAFFRCFTREDSKNEALLNIYWDKEAQEFIADAPEQVVTEVSVDTQIGEKYADDRYIHYMDIHSHNAMHAFFSNVDDHDEKATRLYTVIGKLNECVPEVKTRISNGGKFLEIDPAEVFEPVEMPFPAEWKDKVSFRSQCKKASFKAFSKLFKVGKKIRKLKKKAVALCGAH